MATRSLIPVAAPRTYAELRKAVELTLIQGQQAIEQAKVRTYWDTGRLIHEHVLLFKDRADYGSGTIAQLSADMSYHRSTLQRCVQFYLAVSNCATWRNLTWAHYKELIPIEDPRLRHTLAADANRQAWTVARLRDRIIELAPKETIDVETDAVVESRERLKPKLGTPGTYQVANVEDAKVVDLGFACYLDLTEEQAAEFRAGQLVRVDAAGRIAAADDATKADLFHYRVEILRVVDGDTLWIKIYLRPRQWLKQKLRLRGLDCPEISTPEGKAAKRFVDALVADATDVTIATTKPDKYDRYLADVFLTTKQNGEDPVFLNNTLLENGQAVRKDAWDFSDWGLK